MPKPWLPLAALLSLVLSACGGVAGNALSEAAAPASSVASDGASASPSAAPSLPAGHAWQVIEDVSVSFAVPETWTAMNPKKLLELGDASAFDEMAGRMGITSKQMMQAVGNADLLMLAPPKRGYADNVSGLVVPLEGLPTQAQLEAELGKVSDVPVVVTPGTSPAGPIVTADYTIEVSGRPVMGRSIFVETPDGVLNLSVSALEAVTTAEVSDTIVATMHPA